MVKRCNGCGYESRNIGEWCPKCGSGVIREKRRLRDLLYLSESESKDPVNVAIYFFTFIFLLLLLYGALFAGFNFEANSGAGEPEINDGGEVAADENSSEETDESSVEEVPDYEIVKQEDISYGDVIRLRVEVRSTDPVVDLSDEEFRQISEEITGEITDEKDVNSITIFFWEDSATIGAESAYARMTWAPEGDLSDADAVSAGDYSQHKYELDYLKEWMEAEEEEELLEDSEITAAEAVSHIESEGVDLVYSSDDYGPLIVHTPVPADYSAMESDAESIALGYAEAYEEGYRATQLTGMFTDDGSATHIFVVENEWVEAYLTGEMSREDYVASVQATIEQSD